jgi:hypothetical protein
MEDVGSCEQFGLSRVERGSHNVSHRLPEQHGMSFFAKKETMFRVLVTMSSALQGVITFDIYVTLTNLPETILWGTA